MTSSLEFDYSYEQNYDWLSAQFDFHDYSTYEEMEDEMDKWIDEKYESDFDDDEAVIWCENDEVYEEFKRFYYGVVRDDNVLNRNELIKKVVVMLAHHAKNNVLDEFDNWLRQDETE